MQTAEAVAITVVKHIAVVFELEDDPEEIIVRPIVAFPVREYGD
jgi:hypothetical protein